MTDLHLGYAFEYIEITEDDFKERLGEITEISVARGNAASRDLLELLSAIDCTAKLTGVRTDESATAALVQNFRDHQALAKSAANSSVHHHIDALDDLLAGISELEDQVMDSGADFVVLTLTHRDSDDQTVLTCADCESAVDLYGRALNPGECMVGFLGSSWEHVGDCRTCGTIRCDGSC